jgi:hypothetical protein
MSSRRRSPIAAHTAWTSEELARDLATSVELFRRERLEEPLEAYLEQFEEVRDAVEDLLASTADLMRLEEGAEEILTDPRLLEGLRYFAGPPISKDDLATLIDSPSLAPATLRKNPELVRRIIEAIRTGLDRRRFPWVTEQREPTSEERHAAVIASAALIATQRIATSRRSTSKLAQEEQVRQALLTAGLVEVTIPQRHIHTLAHAPKPGHFCGEVTLGTRKADLVVGLWDGRVMPVECKVSNSSTNSVKRLNNDAAVKAEVWLKDFGTLQVVPVAVLSGVYKLRNLEEAQQRGLTLYWAHRLGDLTTWIETTRGA